MSVWKGGFCSPPKEYSENKFKMKCYIQCFMELVLREKENEFQRSNFNPFTPTNCPDSNPPYTLHWNPYGLEKLLFESTNNYLIDIFIYSHSWSVWYCKGKFCLGHLWELKGYTCVHVENKVQTFNFPNLSPCISSISILQVHLSAIF